MTLAAAGFYRCWAPRDCGGLEAQAVYTDGTRTVAAGNDLFWLDPDDGSWRVVQNTPNTTSVFAIGDDAYLGSRPSGLFRSPGLFSASGAALETLSTSPTYAG